MCVRSGNLEKKKGGGCREEEEREEVSYVLKLWDLNVCILLEFVDELWAEIRVAMCDFVGILLLNYVLKLWD